MTATTTVTADRIVATIRGLRGSPGESVTAKDVLGRLGIAKPDASFWALWPQAKADAAPSWQDWALHALKTRVPGHISTAVQLAEKAGVLPAKTNSGLGTDWTAKLGKLRDALGTLCPPTVTAEGPAPVDDGSARELSPAAEKTAAPAVQSAPANDALVAQLKADEAAGRREAAALEATAARETASALQHERLAAEHKATAQKATSKAAEHKAAADKLSARLAAILAAAAAPTPVKPAAAAAPTPVKPAAAAAPTPVKPAAAAAPLPQNANVQSVVDKTAADMPKGPLSHRDAMKLGKDKLVALALSYGIDVSKLAGDGYVAKLASEVSRKSGYVADKSAKKAAEKTAPTAEAKSAELPSIVTSPAATETELAELALISAAAVALKLNPTDYANPVAAVTAINTHMAKLGSNLRIGKAAGSK